MRSEQHIEPDLDSLLEELSGLPPDRRLMGLGSVGPLDALLLNLAEAAARRIEAEPTRALRETQVVVDIADEAGLPLAQARARRARARALSYEGRFDEALAVCGEAIEIAERSGQAVEAGRAMLASMHALGELGRLQEAIGAGQVARSMLVVAGEPALAARADINLGITYQRQDQPGTAIECFERAGAVVADEPLLCGHIQNNRGEALLALNDFGGAEAAFTEAMEAFEAGGASLTAAIAEGNLADLAARQGRLQRALLFFERARRRLEADRSPVHLARLLAEQAEAKARLGLPEEALAEYEHALADLDRCGLALEAARARCGMGLIEVRRGRHTAAETLLAAAATAFDELGHTTARARVDLVRADLAAANGRQHEAHRLAVRALAGLTDRPTDAAVAHFQLARLAMADDRPDLADAELAAAAAMAREFDLAPLLAELLHTAGRWQRTRGQLDEAIDSMTASVAQVERVRSTLQADRFRTAFLGGHSVIYEDLARALVDRGGPHDIAAAFNAAEQAKSRTLLDQVLTSFGFDEGPEPLTAEADPATLRERFRRAQAELNALYSRLDDEQSSAGSAEVAARWRESVRRREEELDALESRLGTTRGSTRLLARPVELAAARRLLPTDGLLLEYFIIGSEIIVFVVDGDGVEVIRGLADVSEVADRLRRVQFQMSRAMRPGVMAGPRAGRLIDDARRELAALGRLLLGPVRRRLAAVRHLTIVPHGILHLVPFPALWNGHAYPVETHRIHHAPSASVLSQLHETPASAGVSGRLVVGVADDISPLITGEALHVAEILDCSGDEVLIGAEGTAERVTARAPGAGLIHLACHGRFSETSPAGSGVRLADRWLTVRDIYALRLRADLVTLSGCETGLNLVSAGSELMGLVRGFLAAGARSMLVSLWRVNDESTRELMATFYNRWCADPDAPDAKAAALRDAQLALLEHCPHPAFWAPFVLVGRS